MSYVPSHYSYNKTNTYEVFKKPNSRAHQFADCLFLRDLYVLG